MRSEARADFAENSQDVQNLLRIHSRLTQPGPGRKYAVDILNRSAIVFITACWEAYIEDVCREVFNSLMDDCKVPERLPSKVRSAVAIGLKSSKNPLEIWRLAGRGWKEVMKKHLQTAVARFHTPNSENIDELFTKTMSIKKISSSWSWKGIAPENSREKLDHFIRIRGKIAHRSKHRKPVHKSHVKDYFQHVNRLVEKTDRALEATMLERFNIHPW